MTDTTWKAEADADGWSERARTVAASLAASAAERSASARPPHREVTLLKDSGLITLLGPAEHGGGAQEWPVADRVVRIVSAADPALGELLGRHYVWVRLASFIATREKTEHIDEVSARARWLFGGSLDVRGAALTVRDRGDDIVFNGRITPSTAARVSDITLLEGRFPDGSLVSSLAMSTHVGLTFEDDEAGTVTVRDADIPWSGALGYIDKVFQPRAYNDLLVPTLHLVLAQVTLGTAAGRLAAGEHPHSGRTDLGAALRAVEDEADAVSEEAGELHRRAAALTGSETAAHADRTARLLARARAAASAVTGQNAGSVPQQDGVR
ncbi:acyl-CoA dehydrogenase family protein [Streptomyces sp. NPDC002514]|uniref:monooxygenase n=1 Tax=Streptomyces sp. NPDC001270 TaxID=3364554 RepID=UPI00369038A0